MSLNYIGLHRQFPSPTSTVALASPRISNQDVTEDNKDVLVERLNDLVLRLSKDSSVEDTTISAIHTSVDQIEVLLKKEKKVTYKKTHSLGEATGSPKTTEDALWTPLTPTLNTRMRFADSPISSSQSVSRETTMSAERAAEIARAAEELTLKLTATLATFQTRREEVDHIHDLLVTRVELAAERILVLEYRVKEMEEDFDTNQSELKFLRIQLQAIQTQCAQYIPQDTDPELEQSIMDWKVDWEDIDKRSKARRKKCHSSSGSMDSHGTVTESLTDMEPGMNTWKDFSALGEE